MAPKSMIKKEYPQEAIQNGMATKRGCEPACDMDSFIQLGNTVLRKECAGILFSVQVRKI